MKHTQQTIMTSHERTINNCTKTEQKIEKKYDTHPLSPTQTLTYMKKKPHTSHPPITWSNMFMISLVQMRQCNECRSLRNDIIFNLYLGSGAGPWVSIPCLLQDTNHIHWLYPPKILFKKKQKNLKKDRTPKKSYCIALAYVHRTQV